MPVMDIRRLTLLLLALLVVNTAVAEAKRAAPPTAKDLVGVWTGFDEDDLTFTRLELRADSTGYCARASPADTILHSYGVQVYRVDRWSIGGCNVTIDLTPLSPNAEPVYLRGRAGGIASLKLEIGGLKNKWKLGLILNPESRIQVSNEETRGAINARQR